jgi:hypothetical protein
MVNLQNNISGFISSFAKNTMIDYHIGVLAIYDSTKDPEKNPSFSTFPIGQLLPMTDPASAADPSLSPTAPNRARKTLDNVRYVTRQTPKLQKTLGDTINIGWWDGPEFEEVFSPILYAIDAQPAVNAGFFRPDAHLVVIMVTDADDSTIDVSPSQAYDKLVNFKGGDKNQLMLFAAISPGNEPGCNKDPNLKNKGRGAGPDRIISLVDKAGSNGGVFSLCSPRFGKELASIGEKINERVGRKVIKLPYKPDFSSTIEIKYGTQTRSIDLKKGEFPKGWLYDPENNTLIINPDHDLNMEPGANFSIKMTPVQLVNETNGRTKKF